MVAQEPRQDVESVINVITPEMPSIKKLKSYIHYLKKWYPILVYHEDEKEMITVSRTELAATIELWK